MNRLNGTPATALIERPGQPTIDVIEAKLGSELDAVLQVRRRVFSDEQGMVNGRVSDQDDRRSLQALALWQVDDHATPVGTGRVTLGAGDRGEALISWVATLPWARHHGVGREVMRFLIDHAERSGAPMVALAAQVQAAAFYRKLGFISTGRSYLVRGVDHQWMIRRNHRELLRDAW